eukprot:jgi/Mesvir1/1138/Mv17645-RA.1
MCVTHLRRMAAPAKPKVRIVRYVPTVVYVDRRTVVSGGEINVASVSTMETIKDSDIHHSSLAAAAAHQSRNRSVTSNHASWSDTYARWITTADPESIGAPIRRPRRHATRHSRATIVSNANRRDAITDSVIAIIVHAFRRTSFSAGERSDDGSVRYVVRTYRFTESSTAGAADAGKAAEDLRLGARDGAGAGPIVQTGRAPSIVVFPPAL